MKKQNVNKKVSAFVISAAVVASLGAGALASHFMFPKTVEVDRIVKQTIEVPKEVIVEVPVIKNVSIENPLNVEMESEIAILEADIENFEEFLKFAEEKGNDLDLEIFEDAKDVMKNFLKEQNALEDCVDYVKRRIADKLEDEDLVADEDEVDFKRAKTDYDEYEVSNVDYEDNQFNFEFEIIVKDDGETKTFDVEVSFDDGDIEIESIN